MAAEKKMDEGLSEADKKRTTVAVRGHVQRLLAKVAGHRNVSIEALFEEKDVLTFFQHMLIEEMRKETERLQGGAVQSAPSIAVKPGKK